MISYLMAYNTHKILKIPHMHTQSWREKQFFITQNDFTMIYYHKSSRISKSSIKKINQMCAKFPSR